MKKYLISVVLSTNFMFSAGIPVIDAVSNAQALAQNIKTIAEWAKEAERWVDTTKHFSSQLTAYENELLSKTGIRDSVSFVKDLNKLQEYSKVYGDDYLELGVALTNKNSVIGRKANQLFDKYNIFDECKNEIYKDWEKEACQNKLTREVETIATVQETKKIVDKSSQNLENLSKKVSNTQDIKESQDIANAINMEIAQMQIVQMKMDMLSKQNEALSKAELERDKKKILSSQNKQMKW
ncbi:type IV secretion system protein [Aliarcobacter butzleri]|uniref:type IV secretion system protein n=2 Tax=Aliarcobacter butzleri TaxID=28197 RepID=UPI001EDB9534|nr:type IV secretion system protein [Aliarcobacter butzleri]MCG3667484.1 type IV secretion system protein [Aliarcobacter butzleri]MCG3703762.1 type IV secretion system protein [Aliarcobacter butzleri]MDN5112935.1 type IV secretion system protein [Aliarcobacter butzleri]